MKYYLGIDIGGSNIKCAVIDECNSLLSFSSVKTSENHIAKAAAKQAYDIINEAGITVNDISASGIGIPGILDSSKGPVVFAPNIHLENNDLITDFVNELKLITNEDIDPSFFYMANDADCAGIAEAYLGAGKEYENLLLLTLGTGIGGAVIFGGRPLPLGKYGGEFGHFPFVAGGKKCSCGMCGCFEQYANAKASHELSFEEYTDNLSMGISGLINIFRPDIVVLAGGVTNEGVRLFDLLNKKIPSLVYAGKVVDPPEVVCTALGPGAGAKGAALLGKLYSEGFIK